MYYNCIKLNRLVKCLLQRGKHFFWSREKNVWTGSFSFFCFFLWKCSVFFHAFFNISIKYELIKGNVVMLFFHCPSFVRSDGIACSIKTSADVVRPRPKQDVGLWMLLEKFTCLSLLSKHLLSCVIMEFLLFFLL